MKKFLPILFFGAIVLLPSSARVFAADVNLTIRDGNTIVFSGAVPLQSTGNISLNDSEGNPHSIDSKSVLSLLNDVDQIDPTWSISNLQYFSSFGSFYLKCLADSFGNECDNWQYAVNGSYPFDSMDQNILSGGENVYLFFGPQHRVVLDSNSITTTNTLMATAQDYDYQNNKWIKRTGVTVGLTQPDPLNPFSPTEIKTQMVDGNGQATFSSVPVGSYNVGIKEDFYFPTETLLVAEAPATGGSAGCCAVASIPQPQNKISEIKPGLVFDQAKAFSFLVSNQKADGSFGEDIYSDWIAVAFSNTNQYEVNKDALKKYLIEHKTVGTLLTDYERRAMALMANGFNPYDTKAENYIKKITKSFDGKQFGDVTEDNDDIFGLIVLQNAGFALDEKIISDVVSFILSKQKANGSWDESVDMTGAGLEALSFSQSVNKNDSVKTALQKAKDFLKQNQKETGGWANVSSTAWAMEGIWALGEKPEDWVKNGKNPLDYLAENQDLDGGVKGENIKTRIWETAYAITALSGKTWNQIMQKFEKVGTSTTIKVAKKSVATAIVAVTPLKTEEIEPVRPNWFRKFFQSIFDFFF